MDPRFHVSVCFTHQLCLGRGLALDCMNVNDPLGSSWFECNAVGMQTVPQILDTAHEGYVGCPGIDKRGRMTK